MSRTSRRSSLDVIRRRRSVAPAAVLASAALVLAACAEHDPSAPEAARTLPHLSVGVSAAGIARLAVEVTAPDLREPLLSNVHLTDGRAEESVAIPAGAERRLVVRGYDVYGRQSHEGTTALDKLVDGENVPLDLTLDALEGGESVRATLDLVGEDVREAVVSMRAEPGELLEGGSLVLRADVRDREGRPIEVRPGELHWAVGDPRMGDVSALTDDQVAAAIQAWRFGTMPILVAYHGQVGHLEVYVNPNPYVAVTAGAYHSCALRKNGAAYCWGLNSNGALGDSGVVGSSARPVAVLGGLAFTALSAAGSSTCGVTSAGAVYCWGLNAWSPVPKPLPGPAGVTFTAVALGGQHVCALAAGGAAYCSGSNTFGQLGIGFYGSSRSALTLVAGGHTFVSISAGFKSSCAIEVVPGATFTGTYCWGENDFGQLGNGQSGAGQTFSSALPQRVPGATGLSTLGQLSYADASCGLDAAGDASCWGANNMRQLGTASSAAVVTTPTPVQGGLRFLGLSTGERHGCGVTVSNDAYCWGNNGYGQLGTGATVLTGNIAAPTAVVGGLKFSSVAVGYLHSCALGTDGAIYCWGDDGQGQLGDATLGGASYAPSLVAAP